MIDLKKLDREDLEFVALMAITFLRQDELEFNYYDIDFGVDYKDNKIWIYECNENGRSVFFDNDEDFFEVFLLKEKEFLNKIDKLLK